MGPGPALWRASPCSNRRRRRRSRPRLAAPRAGPPADRGAPGARLGQPLAGRGRAGLGRLPRRREPPPRAAADLSVRAAALLDRARSPVSAESSATARSAAVRLPGDGRLVPRAVVEAGAAAPAGLRPACRGALADPHRTGSASAPAWPSACVSSGLEVDDRAPRRSRRSSGRAPWRARRHECRPPVDPRRRSSAAGSWVPLPARPRPGRWPGRPHRQCRSA